MRKLFKLFICLLLAAALISGCGRVPGNTDNTANASNNAAENSASEAQNSANEAQNTSAEPQPPADPGSHYTFRPKVWSAFYEEVFGSDMREAWYNLVDAVMAGEDHFACKDDHTYNWVMGIFPYSLLPPLYNQIYTAGEDPNHPVKDGVGYITYLVPKEELAARIAAFSEQVEGILNEVFKDDYSDLEKAFTLYQYFTAHYTYDYDTYYKMDETVVEYTSAYRLFTEGTGICGEIAPAYAYLLMQTGVDAANMGGNRAYDGMGHDWVYVRINGREYHIDPTYAIGDEGKFAYFMMTDEIRDERDDYPKKKHAIICNYSTDHPHPEYTADDDHFSPLWDAVEATMDHASHTINYKYFNNNYELQDGTFGYLGY